MLCFVAVLVIEYRGFRKRTKEYRELEHFAEFLSDLKEQFYLCKNVTESIFRAAERAPGNLRKGLEEICFLLEEDAGDSAIGEERFTGHLKYVRLFWIQCRSAVQYGSGKNSTESVFVKNMTELRRDVQNECYQRMQAMYLFAGMGMVAVMPVVFLPLIRWFGSVTMEELQVFYEGKAGRGIAVVFGILTVCCYMILCMVRQTDRRLYQKPKFLHEIRFPEGRMQYRVVCGGSGIITAGVVMVFAGGEKLQEQLAAGIVGMLIGVTIGVGFYKYLEYLQRLGTESEVLNLQAMILLLMDVPNITIGGILDVLGASAELFQKRLMQCADEYAAEDTVALERMFEDAEHAVFRQLAGRLLAGEKIGVKAAFSELAADRHFFREQLRMDMEQERKKKAANAQVIAFLPMMFLLFAYLIIPFLGVSLEQMREIFREMEQIRYF